MTIDQTEKKTKVFVYSYRDFDEAPIFQQCSQQLNIELGMYAGAPTMETAHLAAGYPYLSVLTTKVDAKLMAEFHRLGVKMISTRTVGYDHLDIKAAQKYQIAISNATYSANCVADYTIMLMLMAIRHMKRILQRATINDFSLKGILGREMPNFTIGILGTGKIGRQVIRYLQGFGCKIYAYDKKEADEIKPLAEYADLDTIYEKCDLISLHMPIRDDNFHLINRQSIAKMKDHVVIVNTARGALIDSEALIEGLESGKIGAAALDVIEDELGLYYYDLKSEQLRNRPLSILRDLPTAIVTPHMAFYTDQAIYDMVYHSLESCYFMEHGMDNPWRVV